MKVAGLSVTPQSCEFASSHLAKLQLFTLADLVFNWFSRFPPSRDTSKNRFMMELPQEHTNLPHIVTYTEWQQVNERLSVLESKSTKIDDRTKLLRTVLLFITSQEPLTHMFTSATNKKKSVSGNTCLTRKRKRIVDTDDVDNCIRSNEKLVEGCTGNNERHQNRRTTPTTPNKRGVGNLSELRSQDLANHQSLGNDDSTDLSHKLRLESDTLQVEAFRESPDFGKKDCNGL
jgi:hypothetical protein